MKCPHCGTENQEGAKFCIGCGGIMPAVAPVITEVNNEVASDPVIPEIEPEKIDMDINPDPVIPESKEPMKFDVNVKNELLYFLLLMVGIVLKPYTILKEEVEKVYNLKRALIMSGFVAIVSSVLCLLNLMLYIVKPIEIHGFESSWNWGLLGKLNYFSVIWNILLINIGIIAAIAGSFYLIGKIFKIESKLERVIVTAALSLVPIIIGGLILFPILNLFYFLGVIGLVAGSVQFMLILAEGMQLQFDLEATDNKIYFYLASYTAAITVVILVGYVYFLPLFDLLTSFNPLNS